MSSEFRTLANRSLSASELALASRTGDPHHLTKCDLQAIDLAQLDFTDWIFEACTLTGASFAGATLEEATLKGCRASGVNLQGADLSEASILGGDFSNATLRGAKLTHATIRNCKMTGADLSEAQAIGLTLEEVLLRFAVAPKVSFRKMALTRVDFSDADLNRCDFRDTVFDVCTLRDAHLVDSRFDNADLRGADLGASGSRTCAASKAQQSQNNRLRQCWLNWAFRFSKTASACVQPINKDRIWAPPRYRRYTDVLPTTIFTQI